MSMPPDTRDQIIERTVEKIRTFFSKQSELDQALKRGSVDPWRSYSRERGDVMFWVDRCLQMGVTILWLSHVTGISGFQLLGLVDDPRRRAEAHLVETNHHERALTELNAERKRSVIAEFREGEELSAVERRTARLQVTDIATRWGITRPTLYAWVREE